ALVLRPGTPRTGEDNIADVRGPSHPIDPRCSPAAQPDEAVPGSLAGGSTPPSRPMPPTAPRSRPSNGNTSSPASYLIAPSPPLICTSYGVPWGAAGLGLSHSSATLCGKSSIVATVSTLISRA